MGAKASTAGNQTPRTFSNSSSSDVVSAANNATSFNFLRAINGVEVSTGDSRQRARSAGAHFDLSNSPEESNSHDETSQVHQLGIGRVVATSLPSHIWSLNGFKCPVCSKFILPDDFECHIVMCLTKPRLSYNEDILNDQKGECVICLEDLNAGDTIARLPCLCIYHKGCIDRWFDVNRSCPEHPSD